MGLLDKLRETFSDDKQSKSFDVTFNEPKLGMTLAAGGEGQALVTAVIAGGPAARANVKAGDVIMSVNGSGPPKYSDLIATVSALGRPMIMGFSRPGAGAGAGGTKGGGAPSGGGGRSNPFQRAQEAAQRKISEMNKPQPPPMTEEEKRERREAALKAAEARTKDWDKRLNKGRQASSKKETANGFRENLFEETTTSEETRRMVELAKEQEARTAASMGYNPYEARLMGNTAARAAISGAGGAGGGVPIPATVPTPSVSTTRRDGATGAGGGTGGQLFEGSSSEDLVGGAAEGIGAEIEEALGSILEQGPEVSLVAVQTMLKMMKNMAKNSGEDKFKRIRLGNANFHSKVGCIDGGVEVMSAAGYVLSTDKDDAFLQHGSCDPLPLRLRVAMQKLAQAEEMLSDGLGLKL